MHRNSYRSRRGRYSGRRQKTADYLTPFLILIALLIVGVLAFNLWQKLTSSRSDVNAAIHFIEGSAKLKVWGTDSFFDIDDSSPVKQGDEIVLYPGSRAIVSFFDGSILRVDGGSELVFDVMSDAEGESKIELDLKEGDFWLNRAFSSETAELTEVVLDMEEMLVNAQMASVLAVDSEEDIKAIRVFKSFDGGQGAEVSVLAEDLDTVVDTENVGVAQEMMVNSEVISAFREYKSPTVIDGIDDEFKKTSWYEWNVEEDMSPTVFTDKVIETEDIGLVPVEAEIAELEEGQDEEVDDEVAVEEDVEGAEEDLVDEVTEENDEESDDLGDLVKPEIVSVSGGTELDENGFYRVNSNPATLKGSVDGAASVVVNGYTLQKFQPGDNEWVYYANADFDLMKEGENVYEVYAVSAKNERSEVTTVKVFYAVPEPVVEEEIVEDPVVEMDEAGV